MPRHKCVLRLNTEQSLILRDLSRKTGLTKRKLASLAAAALFRFFEQVDGGEVLSLIGGELLATLRGVPQRTVRELYASKDLDQVLQGIPGDEWAAIALLVKKTRETSPTVERWKKPRGKMKNKFRVPQPHPPAP